MSVLFLVYVYIEVHHYSLYFFLLRPIPLFLTTLPHDKSTPTSFLQKLNLRKLVVRLILVETTYLLISLGESINTFIERSVSLTCTFPKSMLTRISRTLSQSFSPYDFVLPSVPLLPHHLLFSLSSDPGLTVEKVSTLSNV